MFVLEAEGVSFAVHGTLRYTGTRVKAGWLSSIAIVRQWFGQGPQPGTVTALCRDMRTSGQYRLGWQWTVATKADNELLISLGILCFVDYSWMVPFG